MGRLRMSESCVNPSCSPSGAFGGPQRGGGFTLRTSSKYCVGSLGAGPRQPPPPVTKATSSKMRSSKLTLSASDNASQTRLHSSPPVRNPGGAWLGAQHTFETSRSNAPRAASVPAAPNKLPNVERITADSRRMITGTNALRKRARRN